MLHLKVPVRSGTSYGEIEYENPLQRPRQEYYSAKLHSVYSSAAETSSVNVPLTFTIQDSGYVAGIESDEINFDLPIKDYSQNLRRERLSGLIYRKEEELNAIIAEKQKTSCG